MKKPNLDNPVYQAFLTRYEEYLTLGENPDNALILTTEEIYTWTKENGQLAHLDTQTINEGIKYLKESGLLTK